MAERESELEMVCRHVRQGRRNVARQEAIIERFRRAGFDTGEAERLLANMQDLQESHLRHLAHLKAKQT